MRGKALTDPCIALCHGITPACAGKRPLPSFPVLSLWDHPRVCGEKCLDGITHGMIAGSPPRVRGKGPDDRAHPLVPGITPACAGKRKPHLHKKGCTWDHPRVCGEKCPNCGRKMKQQGSPPRMRGKVFFYVAAIHGFGITPAYAGKSCSSSVSSSQRMSWTIRSRI